MEFQLLGDVQARHDGQPVGLGGRRQKCVLAVLLLIPGRIVPVGRIIEYAWSGDPPDTAPDLVASYVSRLRRALCAPHGGIGLTARRPGYIAELDTELVDAHRFTRLLREASQARATQDDETAMARLEHALQLWQSEVAISDLDSPWLRARAFNLENQRLEAAEHLATLYLSTAQPERAITLLRDYAPDRPDRDDLVALLVHALSAVGEHAQAIELADHTLDALDQRGHPAGPRLREARRHAQRPPAGRRTPSPLRQLPADTRSFTGRDDELAELLRAADETPALVISAIDGMAGIGKTALAIRAAHLLADQYPDGQLFLDLHGYTQGMAPRDSADALAVLLRAFGLAPQQIPEDLGARAALYRDRLSGTKTLIVLDNAATETQVRPLLPGNGTCLVLITSRKRLTALDDAHTLPLDLLPIADSVALFRRVAGHARTPANTPDLEETVRLCGQLPLALRIAAALLRSRVSWTVQHLADKLRTGQIGLTGFRDTDRDLTVVFNLSYRALNADQQKLFRRIGLVPGPEADCYAAAALLETDPVHAEQFLQDLVDHNVLTETAPGRYRFHDLIRTHARTLCLATDPESERTAAQGRLLHYYAHTAGSSSVLIARLPRPAPHGPAPAHAPDLNGPQAAWDWLRTEHPNLDAAFTQTGTDGLDGHAIALAAGLAEILQTDGPWTRALEIHRAAAAAAERLDRPAAHSTALTNLGRVRFLTGDFPGAVDAQARALEIFRQTGDRLGEANALTELGRVRFLTGDFPGAADAQARALEIFRQTGDRLGEANALTELGRVRYQHGDLPSAEDALARALEISRQISNCLCEATALTYLGKVQHSAGDLPGAEDAQALALEIFRRIGSRLGEATALTNLGRVRYQCGDFPGAEHAQARALDISRLIGNRLGEANALAELGKVRHQQGDFPRAEDAQARALQIFRRTGSRLGEAWTLNHYAATIAATGDRHRALALYQQAQIMNREMNKPDDEALSLEGIAEHHLAEGNTPQGAAYLRQALEIYQRHGMRTGIDRVQTRLVGLAPQ